MRDERFHVIAVIAANRSPASLASAIQRAAEMPGGLPACLHLALNQGLGPLVYRSLRSLPSDTYAAYLTAEASSALDRLERVRNEAAVHAALAVREQERVQRIFNDHDIPSIWLKGVALAQTVYPSLELRPMVDMDVLVPYEQREQALSALQIVGYELPTAQLFSGTEGLKHHYFLKRANAPLQLEVHFRLVGYLDRILRVEDHKWFWHHRQQMLSESGVPFMILSPEAHLLYLAAHALLQHGEADMRLLRYYDMDRLITVTPNFDWSKVIDGAVQIRWTYALKRSLEITQTYFSTEVTTSVLRELDRRRPQDENISHATRRSHARTTTEVVLDDLVAMSWRDRIRAARMIVAPSPHYMRQRYDVQDDRLLPAAYVRRMYHMMADALLSINRRLKSTVNRR